MIRYLQHLRAKKGFTIIELIVVVAIIGVLIAVIVPNVGNDRSKIQAARTRANDFYSAVQYTFSKYARYESYLSMDLKTDIASRAFIDYFPSVNGNYPVNKVTFLEMRTNSSGDISYVHLATDLATLLSDTSTTSTNAFAELLAKDIASVFHGEDEGYYFAYIEFTDASAALTSTSATVKVKIAHYMSEDLPSSGATLTSDYINGNLIFSEYGRLANNIIVGTCSDMSNSSGVYIGDTGTYFMNKGDEV